MDNEYPLVRRKPHLAISTTPDKRRWVVEQARRRTAQARAINPAAKEVPQAAIVNELIEREMARLAAEDDDEPDLIELAS